MIVSNMQSRKGNDVPNQFVIEYKEGTMSLKMFQSYKSNICLLKYNYPTHVQVVELDAIYWNYSRTTSKYLSMFLNECTADIKKKIKDGTYKLANLN